MGKSGITCSDVIVTEIVREIMLETAAHLTPQTRAAIRKELQFPPTAKKITSTKQEKQHNYENTKGVLPI